MKENNKNNDPIQKFTSKDFALLDNLQRETFEYFLKEQNPENGLVKDSTMPKSPCSVAGLGMCLSAYIVADKNKYFSRKEAAEKTLTLLNFLYNSPQGTGKDAIGYKGFYYHFIDMKTGKRAWSCELSTIDTAILLAGVLTVGNYFLGKNREETAIRELADNIYRRIDWQWALNGSDFLCHGWKPETGFLPYSWDSKYSEAHLLYIFAMGSTTFPISNKGYKKWIKTFEWKKLYGIEYFYAGPLFIHQMSQVWLDFNGITDEINRQSGIDYFENSARATRVQQLYAIDNPSHFFQYGEKAWGFTASNGPGYRAVKVNGIERVFYDYVARGIPYGPDDGTISPWAAVTSLPFAPDIVLTVIKHAIEELELKKHSKYGFDASFNPTFPEIGANPNGWISPWQYALNQGPVILMIENFKSKLIWNTLKKCPYVIQGLKTANFEGGWLNDI
ncbi:glucoamylase family protein [Arachidicoccus sp.]|uniref:glucoamylase family protein n=1 Tax=Arachidicoccus sp. TaxID=1872624 RepID=UPI003D20E41F